MLFARHHRPTLCLLAGCAILTIAAGCEVFRSSPGILHTAEKKLLPKLQPPPDAIELEIVYAEHPTGDRRFGEPLWREVDEYLNNDDPQLRKTLERNGFRAGVVGSTPPEALQQLIGLKSDLATDNFTQDSKKLNGRRIYLRSGTETQVYVSQPYLECDYTVYQDHESKSGDVRHLENMTCSFRVTANRLQDGWITLDFVPEVQHGVEKMRPNAGAQDWNLESSQRKERLYAQRFGVKLNLGEIAVVTGRDSQPGTVGYRFFMGPEGGDEIQRVLLIRLSHMSKQETAPKP